MSDMEKKTQDESMTQKRERGRKIAFGVAVALLIAVVLVLAIKLLKPTDERASSGEAESGLSAKEEKTSWLTNSDLFLNQLIEVDKDKEAIVLELLASSGMAHVKDPEDIQLEWALADMGGKDKALPALFLRLSGKYQEGQDLKRFGFILPYSIENDQLVSIGSFNSGNKGNFIWAGDKLYLYHNDEKDDEHGNSNTSYVAAYEPEKFFSLRDASPSDQGAPQDFQYFSFYDAGDDYQAYMMSNDSDDAMLESEEYLSYQGTIAVEDQGLLVRNRGAKDLRDAIDLFSKDGLKCLHFEPGDDLEAQVKAQVETSSDMSLAIKDSPDLRNFWLAAECMDPSTEFGALNSRISNAGTKESVAKEPKSETASGGGSLYEQLVHDMRTLPADFEEKWGIPGTVTPFEVFLTRRMDIDHDGKEEIIVNLDITNGTTGMLYEGYWAVLKEQGGKLVPVYFDPFGASGLFIEEDGTLIASWLDDMTHTGFYYRKKKMSRGPVKIDFYGDTVESFTKDCIKTPYYDEYEEDLPKANQKALLSDVFDSGKLIRLRRDYDLSTIPSDELYTKPIYFEITDKEVEVYNSPQEYIKTH